MKSTLVTSRMNPDLDGVACIFAYQKLLNQQGREVDASIFGEPQPEARYVMDKYKIPAFAEPKNTYDQYIIVDAIYPEWMPPSLNIQKVVEIVDHRFVIEPEKIYPHAKIQNELIGAAATLITEKYIQANASIDHQSALLLYGAIYCETLNFKTATTSDRDHQAAAWLKQHAQIPDDLGENIFLGKTRLIVQNLESTVDISAKKFTLGGQVYEIFQLELYEAHKLLQQHQKKLLDLMHARQRGINHSFYTVTALDENANYFLTDDIEVQNTLIKAFGVKFEGVLARFNRVLLRKELIPKIKKLLE